MAATDDRREFLHGFKETNLNAGCDPAVVDICMAYARHCLSKGLPVQFEPLHPSTNASLEDAALTGEQRTYLCELRDHLWGHLPGIPDRFARLVLWYSSNLLKQGCEVLLVPTNLANRLDMPESDLHYIASDSFPGYAEFDIPKRGGGTRPICAPVPKLRWIQRWILDHVLSGVILKDCATAYVKNRSIRHNAAPHVGAKVVVSLDLRSFFPSISFQRVSGLYLQLGYSYSVALLLTKLCCFKGVLPQGAPTSPAISNLICRRMDSRMLGLAQAKGLHYTRYADDITVSGDRIPSSLIRTIKRIIEGEGFELASEKTHVTRRGQSQRVTGLVVNEKVNMPRRYYRRIRAVIHNCQRFGVASQNREGNRDFRAVLYGHAYYINSINPSIGGRLLEQLEHVNWES